MMRVFVDSVGLVGPGLPSWAVAQEVMRGARPHNARDHTRAKPPARLPAAERRRAGDAIKVAMAVADEAVTTAAMDPQTLATVFASSSGEGTNCHTICETLASDNAVDFANAVRQFRAQRAVGLLAHCSGQPRPFDQHLRVRRQFCGRVDRGGFQDSPVEQARAAGGQRHAIPRATSCHPAVAVRVLAWHCCSRRTRRQNPWRRFASRWSRPTRRRRSARAAIHRWNRCAPTSLRHVHCPCCRRWHSCRPTGPC